MATTLEQWASRANQYHDRFKKQVGEALQTAKKAGNALKRAKRMLGHGNWSAWLKENFKGSPETARNYMRVASHWKLLQRILDRNPELSIDGALISIRAAKKKKHDDDQWEPDIWDQYLSTARKNLKQRIQRRILSHWDEDVIILLGQSFMNCDLDDFLDQMHDEIKPVAKVIIDYRKKFNALQKNDPLRKHLRKDHRIKLRELQKDESLTEYQKRVISDELSTLRPKQRDQLRMALELL